MVIALTALVLTFVLARCLMKQSSIGQTEEEEKGCKQSAKAWLDENLGVLHRLRRRRQEEQQSQNDIAQADDIRQVEHVEIRIDDQETSRPNPDIE